MGTGRRRDILDQRSRGGFMAFVGLAFASAWAGATPSSDLPTATRKLGSSAFADRHEAGDVLLRAGATAIPYLREATTSESPEVRFRASELLQRIEIQVLDSQKAEILTGSLSEGLLPAWDRYRELAGDSEPSRRLFIAMLEKTPQLLLSIGGPGFGETFDRRMNDWSTSASPWLRGRGPDTVDELAALLLAASLPECSPTQVQAQSLSKSAELAWFSTQMTGTDRSGPLKALVVGWITHTGKGTAEARLHLAQYYKLREGVLPAREIISQDSTGLETQGAILFLAQNGGGEDIPRLESLLLNEGELQTFRTGRPADALKTQVRDVALVGLWKMHKESPTAHGMKDYVEQNGSPRTGTIGFHSDEDRLASIHHWRAWRKRHVKADLPVDGWAIEGRRG